VPAPPHAPHPRGRVLVEAPPFPLDVVADALADTGIEVETASRPWSGDDIVGVLVWNPLTAADILGLPGLEVAAVCGVGVDQIDVDAATGRGVWVCNVPDYCVEEMADSSLALLLALARGVVELDRSVRAGVWDDHAAGPLHRIRDIRLGLVGFGRIGRAVAARALALGIEVWASDPIVPAEEIAAAGAHASTLDDLLRSCTAISLHAPLRPETHGLIGERELALLPDGAFLVNVSRAALVETPALLRALRSGRLGGAALDVLEVEPPDTSAPAPQAARLIVTPHASWYSPQAEEAVYRRAALAVRDVLEGRRPAGAVNEPVARSL